MSARPGDVAAGHEQTDVRARPVALALVGLAALVLFAAGLATGLVAYYGAREAGRSAPESAIPARRVPPEPRLQEAPALDLAKLRAAEDALLQGYGWVDRERGVVRIPIDEAMRIKALRDPVAESGSLRDHVAERAEGERGAAVVPPSVVPRPAEPARQGDPDAAPRKHSSSEGAR
jgi:hypothetical protein